MRKGYYIYFGAQDSSGVNKKIEMQVREMDKFFRIDTIEVPKIPRNFFKKILGLMPWISNNYDYDMLLAKLKDPDFIYIRTVLADKKYVAFLRDVRRKYPECRIMIEYPTFPYEREHLKIGEIFFLLKDVIYRKKLNPYVNRFVTYSQDEKIWGVPTIKVVNGIDIASIKPMEPRSHSKREIHLIAVAMFQEYHGYERIIKGMSDYYKRNSTGKRMIYLHMVGDGPEKKRYIELVNKLHLEDKVLFYGSKKGKDLDELYNKADLAVSSLGCYKLKIDWLSALKTREYLAKGLPMITGCRVDVLTQDFPYFLQFENNSTTISVDGIVEFYDRLYDTMNSSENMIANIRKFAEETVDMKVTMEPIIRFLNNL